MTMDIKATVDEKCKLLILMWFYTKAPFFNDGPLALWENTSFNS